MKTRSWAAIAIAAALAAPASAQPLHDGDIVLAVTNGRIATGGGAGQGQFVPIRVFAGSFGNLGENITNNPGFDAVSGTFPAGTANGFRILSAVRAWDGAAFSQVPPERIAVTRSTFNPPPPAFSPLTDEPVTGFTIAVSGDGRWHHHLEYNLIAPAADGVYLLELEIFNTGGTLLPTRPFWLVLNKARPAPEHAEAVEWAEYVLARVGCPADFDRNRAVNSGDISAFITAWLHEVGLGPAGAEIADVNADGVVNSADISAFITLWLAAAGQGC